MKFAGIICFLILSAWQSIGQSDQARTSSTARNRATSSEHQIQLPSRTLDFKIVESSASPSLSPITVFPPKCTADGTLFLDALDPTDLRRHSIISVSSKSSRTYSADKISDLNDVLIRDFFPTDEGLYMLVRASREAPGIRDSGTSPAGIPWASYHHYVVKFNNDGSYGGSTELSPHFDLLHLAVFPSGDFIVSGYDRVNSAVRLLYLTSSGELGRPLDLPAARDAKMANEAFDSGDAFEKANHILGSVFFTAYGQDILVWTRNGNEPILDIKQGGGVREVPLQLPPQSAFVDMLTSNDRWVGHFRSTNVPQDSPLTQDGYAYYEMHSQDAGLSLRLIQGGASPLSLACESDGKYVSFKRAKDGKLILLYGD